MAKDIKLTIKKERYIVEKDLEEAARNRLMEKNMKEEMERQIMEKGFKEEVSQDSLKELAEELADSSNPKSQSYIRYVV